MKISITTIIGMVMILLTLLSLASLGYGMISISQSQLSDQVYNHLTTASISKAQHLITFLKDQKEAVQSIAIAVVFKDLLSIESNSSRYSERLNSTQSRLEATVETNPSFKFAVLADKEGTILADSSRGQIGTSIGGLQIFKEGIRGVYLQEPQLTPDIWGSMVWISAPVKLPDGEMAGVFLAGISMDQIDRIATSREGLGQSGEAILLSKDRFLLSPSRYWPDAKFNLRLDTLHANLCEDETKTYETKKDISILRAEVPKEYFRTLDYRGVPSIVTHSHIEPEASWCLETKIDESEALGALRSAQWRTMVLFLGILIFVVAVLSFFLARVITRPIKRLADDVDSITKGDFKVEVGSSRISEIELLSQSLGRILASMKLAILRTGATKEEMGIGEALRIKEEAEKKLASVVKNVPGAIYRCANDANWTMNFISDSIKDITGYPASDFINNKVRSYASVIHPDDRKMVEEAVQEGVKNNRAYEMTYRIINSKGQVRYVFEKGHGIFENSQLVWLDGTIIDNTRLEKTKQEVIKQEKRMEIVVKNSGQIIYDYDLKSGKINWTGAILDVTGYTAQEFANFGIKRWERSIHPQDRSSALKSLDLATKTQIKLNIEYRFRRKDGSFVPIHDEAAFFKASDGTYHLVGAMKDISDQRRRSEQIGLFKRFFDNSPNSMVLAVYGEDKQPAIMTVNKSFTKFYGYDPRVVTGKNPNVINSGYQDKGFYRAMWRDILDPKKGFWTGLVRNRRKDGSFIDVILSITTLFDEKGKARFFIASHTDAKAISALEEEHTQRMFDWNQANIKAKGRSKSKPKTNSARVK